MIWKVDNCRKDQIRSDQSLSRVWLCNAMNRSTPGLPVHHQLPEFTETHVTHVHRVSDAIQPSHPMLSPSPSAFNLSQHQGLFRWVGSLHQVAEVLELQLQHQSFQWIFRVDFIWDWLGWSPCSSRDSQESCIVCQCVFSWMNFVGEKLRQFITQGCDFQPKESMTSCAASWD